MQMKNGKWDGKWEKQRSEQKVIKTNIINYKNRQKIMRDDRA